ncbi:hypothetical protein [Vibrio sp. MED222]|uniref:hypothetical protein n=1 Tax=Vibrio sp. MED222 TaxID=314290 RepID=UPI000068ECF3|nr:hypothetical protein [Vibrio sp. MED222]EAQ55526.1 hypothetical protein MED222_08898 [Vibrio sp. MED222]
MIKDKAGFYPVPTIKACIESANTQSDLDTWGKELKRTQSRLAELDNSLDEINSTSLSENLRAKAIKELLISISYLCSGQTPDANGVLHAPRK